MINKNSGLPAKVFVTGTDTGIGKTVVSAILTLGMKANYWKPIQAGLDGETDSEWVRRTTGLPDNQILSERFRLREPLSPHLASSLDGIKIQLDDFILPDIQSPLIIEGAGGVMVPINEKDFIVDMIRLFEVPVILVARSTLGTINHTLLTLDKLKSLDIPVWGVVLNGRNNPENKKAIERFGRTPVIAEIGEINHFEPETLQALFDQKFSL